MLVCHASCHINSLQRHSFMQNFAVIKPYFMQNREAAASASELACYVKNDKCIIFFFDDEENKSRVVTVVAESLFVRAHTHTPYVSDVLQAVLINLWRYELAAPCKCRKMILILLLQLFLVFTHRKKISFNVFTENWGRKKERANGQYLLQLLCLCQRTKELLRLK